MIQFLLFTIGLVSVTILHAYELKNEYYFNNHTITSDLLFPEISKKFEILRIPEDKSLYRVDALIIAKTFELNGIAVDVSKTRYINFIKKSPVDFTPIKIQLESKLVEKYPDINIDEIIITPRGFLPSLPKNTKVYFDERFYLNSEGTLYIIDANGLRRYLDYNVHATLAVLHTSQSVVRKEKLNGFNTILKPIPFKTFKDAPLTQLPDKLSRYRSNLKANQPLTFRQIETMPLVLKNEKVIVEVKNDLVIVEFGAIAVQEGSLYDIITIQKSDGKRVKAKVIGENRVELL
ncbi:flagellar basal body P-ring formation chaperone FlgA [Sulfuricurvum sp.]|uniref:flagellar basal body P-ring formation chaperone FlgA n=1 Tax=Sulfuricurvum sp. TaxID=2025608 RepID=UPI00199F33E0|nr:flagellar basal body P-ring formation chaperone FlgA [Sulfuricurvum sp.]MBD3798307.1 flagellar basal body P-ring formation protein FlgA [Campylobacterota bacterium]MBD3805656.1 flagellar basal body P-ring formation protein FlgA [Sulfuricurvum sp.]